MKTMIFKNFSTKLLDTIDINIEYYIDEIEINIKWSVKTDFIKYKLSYIDDECTLPLNSPLYYICSSESPNKLKSLNSTFYSYWFTLENSFYQRVFSHVQDSFILLICLSDGRILSLTESLNDSTSIVWYTSLSTHPITILGLYYDLNRNLLDAILSSSTTNSKFPKIVLNHLILCETIGSLVIIDSINIRRVLLDNFIKSPCIYLNNFLYITKNEIRSVTVANLLKLNNENLINQTKTLRFGHFQKLVVGKF